MSSEIGLTGFGFILDSVKQAAVSAKYWHMLYSKEFDSEENAKNAFAIVAQVRSVLADSFEVYVRTPTRVESTVDFETGKPVWKVYSRFSVTFKEPK